MNPDERNHELDRTLIGGREKREIVIADYDASWPVRFETECARVQQTLGVCAIRVEHIGSTAVPGLAAKPVIDLLVTVEDPEDETATVPALTAIGYELRVREPGHGGSVPLNEISTFTCGTTRTPEVRRYLRFRNRLRDCVEDRQAYERVKRELARDEWSDMNDYAEAKGSTIEDILARADD